MAALFLTTPVDVSLGSFGSWLDIDVSGIAGYTPAVTGVLVEVIVGGSTNRTYGLRKNGSTDNRTTVFWGAANGKHAVAAIGVDASGILEGYAEASDLDFWIVGFLRDDSVFFTNAVDKSTGSTSSWVDVDVSSDTGSDVATGVWLELDSVSGFALSVRKNGSTDDRRTASNGFHDWLYCGCDASELFEQWINATSADLLLVGYAKDGITFNLNAIDRSTVTTGQYVAMPPLLPFAKGGLYEINTAFGTTAFRYNLHAYGDPTDHYYTVNLHSWFAVRCDLNGVVEQDVADTAVDVFELGSFFDFTASRATPATYQATFPKPLLRRPQA